MAIIDFDIDKFMDEIGHFGTSGALMCCLLGIFMSYTSMNSYSFNFITSVDSHRCLIPECENTSIAVFRPEWLKNTMNIKSFPQCKRYKPLEKPQTVNTSHCPAKWFDKNKEISCSIHNLIYEENERNVMRQWDISCEESTHYNNAIKEFHFAAYVPGTLILGIISDMFGRRIVLIIAILLTSCSGIGKFLSWNPSSYLITHTILSCFAGGIFVTAIILAVELVGKRARAMMQAILFSFYTLGLLILAVMLSFKKDWKNYLYFHVVVLPSVFFYFIIPDSIRWLKVKGKEKRLMKELLRLAKWKGIEMNIDYLEKFRSSERAKDILRTKIDDRFIEIHTDENETEDKPEETEGFQKVGEGGDIEKEKALTKSVMNTDTKDTTKKQKRLKKTQREPPSIIKIICSKYILMRFFICLFLWLTVEFSYTMTLTTDKFKYGDKYSNFLLSSMIEIPAYILTPVMSADYGRKKLLFGTLLINSVFFCVLAVLSDNNMVKIGTVIKLLAVSANSLVYGIVSIYTAELFPTSWRQTIFSICISLSRLGPSTYHLWIPVYFSTKELYFFGGLSFASGILVLFLPETTDENLPDTVEEAEAFAVRGGKFWFTKSKIKS